MAMSEWSRLLVLPFYRITEGASSSSCEVLPCVFTCHWRPFLRPSQSASNGLPKVTKYMSH